MSTLARNEKREQLRYTFTPPEREEKGRQLADALNRYAKEESDLDRIKADFKARMATIDAEVGTLKDAVLSGYELREYVCFWEYDAPVKGRKTLRKKEPPHEIVREEDMTEADRQTVMEAIEKQAAEEQAKGGETAEPKKVSPALPVPSAGDDFSALLSDCVAGSAVTRDEKTGFITSLTPNGEHVRKVFSKQKAADLLRFHDWLSEHIDLPGAVAIDSMLCDVLAEAERRLKAAKTAGKRRTSSGGVVATEADGDDLSNPDDSKPAN